MVRQIANVRMTKDERWALKLFATMAGLKQGEFIARIVKGYNARLNRLCVRSEIPDTETARRRAFLALCGHDIGSLTFDEFQQELEDIRAAK